MLTEASLRKSLPVATLGDPWLFLEQTESTNDLAVEHARNGVPHGALFVADLQTAGKGRAGRKWFTPAGCSLAFSLVLRFNSISVEKVGGLTVLGALSVVDALGRFGLNPEIKWPNDVLLEGKKVAGILVETSWLGDVLEYVVLGIGINVHAGSVPQSSKIDFPATCIDEVAKKRFDRTEVLVSILESMSKLLPKLGTEKLVMAWNMHLAYTNQEVLISGVDEEYRGIISGIRSDGRLLLKSDDGEIPVEPGDVILRPIDSGMN